MIHLSIAHTVLLVSMVSIAPCAAASISLTGSLDPNNPNDVFLYAFTLSTASNLTIQSYGYGGSANAPGGANAGGAVIPTGDFDTYISLFDGAGPTATFLSSNDDGVCPPGGATVACHDSTLAITALAAGSYTMALSVFDNFSFAENFGSGTLGDGFIGLGDYFDASSQTVRTSNYAVDIGATGLAIPEPAPWSLTASFLLAAVLGKQIFRRRVQ
jgi:hypothetical protein